MTSKLAKYLILDLNGDWSRPSIKFFRSSGLYGYIAWLIILNAHFEKKNITSEQLVYQIKKYASRRTVINYISKGTQGGFLYKNISQNDKRITFVKPTEITIKEYTEWAAEFIKSVV